jgi:hypothetical protein
MNERDFVAAVESCTLAAGDFHHADHLRLAWIYLRDYPLLDAVSRFTTSLKRFAAHHGAAEKYHETITWAYLLLIYERMQRAGAPCEWERFCVDNGDLFARRPSILERYYAPGTLSSKIARTSFVLPDARGLGAYGLAAPTVMSP